MSACAPPSRDRLPMGGDQLAKRAIRPARRRMLRALDRPPCWDFPIDTPRCWQLLRRGLADYDGRGWRLTEKGIKTLSNGGPGQPDCHRERSAAA